MQQKNPDLQNEQYISTLSARRIYNPKMFRIMNYQPDNTLNCEASQNFHELGALKDEAIKYYMDIVNDGKSDGSINKNLDTKNAVYFGLFSPIGLLNWYQ